MITEQDAYQTSKKMEKEIVKASKDRRDAYAVLYEPTHPRIIESTDTLGNVIACNLGVVHIVFQTGEIYRKMPGGHLLYQGKVPEKVALKEIIAVRDRNYDDYGHGALVWAGSAVDVLHTGRWVLCDWAKIKK